MILGIDWAFISPTTAFVETETQLVINRFLLGMSEGSTLPLRGADARMVHRQ